jgi:hypothetical protein
MEGLTRAVRGWQAGRTDAPAFPSRPGRSALRSVDRDPGLRVTLRGRKGPVPLEPPGRAVREEAGAANGVAG